MLVLKLCQQNCPDKIPLHLAKKLGDGADGEVFELNDRVIKFCVLYDVIHFDFREAYRRINSVIDYLIHNPSPVYARVHERMYMGEWSRLTISGDQKYILYYYIMEKLQKISEDEQKVFHSILSHEDRGIKKNFETQQLKKILSGLQKGLDFDVEKIMFFNDFLRKTPLCHLDIHARNIMKDDQGNFKMIDFDRVNIGDTNV